MFVKTCDDGPSILSRFPHPFSREKLRIQKPRGAPWSKKTGDVGPQATPWASRSFYFYKFRSVLLCTSSFQSVVSFTLSAVTSRRATAWLSVNMSELIQLTILLVVCTAVTCQSPAAVISEICQSESELFIDCPRLNDHQKSRLGQLLNSSSSGIRDMGAFPATSDIMGLYLHDNNIETIEPGAFDRLTSLSHLDVSHNDLTDIGFLSGGQQLLSLTFLDLSHNQIGLIDAASISRLHKLKTLKMNNNPIRALDDDTAVAISKLSNLAVRSDWLSRPVQLSCGHVTSCQFHHVPC